MTAASSCPDRVALIGISQIMAGGNTGPGMWGGVSIYGAGRVRLFGQVWIEGGAGLAGLGYQPPSQISLNGTRFWSPTAEATAGFDIFRGPHVAMSLLVRTSTATFDGLGVHNFSVQLGLTGWH